MKDHPFFILLSIMASVITIWVYVTGVQNLPETLNWIKQEPRPIPKPDPYVGQPSDTAVIEAPQKTSPGQEPVHNKTNSPQVKPDRDKQVTDSVPPIRDGEYIINLATHNNYVFKLESDQKLDLPIRFVGDGYILIDAPLWPNFRARCFKATEHIPENFSYKKVSMLHRENSGRDICWIAADSNPVVLTVH
jgi:hypothetical protein